MRQIILYPGEDGYWVAECPSLPGCISQVPKPNNPSATQKYPSITAFLIEAEVVLLG